MENALVAVFLLVLFVIMPAWAVIYTWRRGQQKWAFLTILTAFMGMGWLVGLIAVMASRNRPLLRDVPQLPCPKCGQQKISVKTVRVERSTGNEIVRPNGYGGFLGIAMIFSALVVAFGSSGSVRFEFEYVPAPIGFLLGFVVGPAFLIQAILAERNYRKIEKVNLFKYRCKSCRHQWQQREDQPVNTITSDQLVVGVPADVPVPEAKVHA